ncbi:unnamed protein product [Lactuca virosa]|uniref:Uncharacterized protein n=1 Tax=Lactuca virosa TaxID=75947 RepID=A0AAU9PEE4_9ASTR|nr:unnamed protein product [Lactuca virosa]
MPLTKTSIHNGSCSTVSYPVHRFIANRYCRCSPMNYEISSRDNSLIPLQTTSPSHLISWQHQFYVCVFNFLPYNRSCFSYIIPRQALPQSLLSAQNVSE